jgi:hypothetical protein
MGGHLTTFEHNVGLAMCGALGNAFDIMDEAMQGGARLRMAAEFARASRMYGCRRAAERHLYDVASALDVAACGVKADGRLQVDKAADLLLFIWERGVQYGRPIPPDQGRARASAMAASAHD